MAPPVAIPSEAIAQLIRNGHSWSATPGTPITVTYAFRATSPTGTDISTFSQFTASQIAAAEQALQAWGAVANINFVRVGSGTFGNGAYSDNATILFGNYTGGSNSASAAFAFSPDPAKTAANELAGDIFINTAISSNTSSLNAGSFGFVTLLHEIGHAIGLEHPGNYNGAGTISYNFDAAYAQDATLYTVMSYFDIVGALAVDLGEPLQKSGVNLFSNWQYTAFAWNGGQPAKLYNPFGLQLYDIAAAQSLYGARTATHSENTTYLFGLNAIANPPADTVNVPKVYTIWDGGGIDTLKITDIAIKQNYVDLRPGHFSAVGVENIDPQGQLVAVTGNLAIGYGVTIENFEGYTQFFFGNDANNFYRETSWVQNAGSGSNSFAHVINTYAGNDTIIANMTAWLPNPPADISYDYFKIDGGAGFDVLQLNWIASDDNAIYNRPLDLNKLTQIVNVEIWEIHARFQFAGTSVNGQPTNMVIGRPGNDVIIIDYSIPSFSTDPNTAGALYGMDGNDILAPDSLFGDTLDGGNGFDQADYSRLAGGINVSLTAGQGLGGYALGDVLISIENLKGTAFDDTLTGADLIANALLGMAGNDLIVGLSGNDTIRGGPGADSLDGGADFDRLSYFDSPSAVMVDLSLNIFSGGDAAGDTVTGFEEVTGSLFNDTLVGTASAANSLLGYDGADQLSGLSGDDTLEGGAGADTLNGGADNDTASYLDRQGVSLSPARVIVNLSTGAASGGDAAGDVLIAIENVTGTIFNDVLTGSASANILTGDAGNDTLKGEDGDDRLFSGLGKDRAEGGNGADYIRTSNGNDTLLGDAGADTLGAGSGNDLLRGGNDADLLLASNGADRLNGEAGDDTLLGGGGRDTLTGDAGNDRLVGGSQNDRFNFAPGSGADLIVDFAGGAGASDTIGLIGWGTAFDSFTDVLNAATQVGADVVINLGGGDSITLQGVTIASLNADDFAFG